MLLSRQEVRSIIDEANFKNLSFEQVIQRRADRWRKWSRNFRPDRLCLLTTDKIAYGTSTAITITLDALATSTTVGRQGTVIDNGTNLFDDVLVTLKIVTSASAIGSSKSVAAYNAGSEDGTNYDCDDAAIGATDAGYTINSPTNLKVASVMNCPTSSKTYYRTYPVAPLYGGIMPRKWTPVVCNDTNQNLGTGCAMTYTGITWTNG